MGCCQTCDSNEFKFPINDKANTKAEAEDKGNSSVPRGSFHFIFDKEQESAEKPLSKRGKPIEAKRSFAAFKGGESNGKYTVSPKIITRKENNEISFGYNSKDNNNSNEVNLHLSSSREPDMILIDNQKPKEQNGSVLIDNYNSKGKGNEANITVVRHSFTNEANSFEAQDKEPTADYQPRNSFKRGLSNDSPVKPLEEEKTQANGSSQRFKKLSSMNEKCSQFIHKYGMNRKSKESLLSEEELAKQIESNINKDKFRPIVQAKSIKNKAQFLLAQILKEPLKEASNDKPREDEVISLIKQKPVVHKKKKQTIPLIFEE